jgi:sugar phosphate isomerase/epimerase
VRFGASTYFLKERSVTDALDVIARLGYASAEIWMEHYLSAQQRPATIARHARALGLALTVHAPSYDVNIISTNPGIRRESRRQVRSCLRLAASVGAAIAVVHPGALSTAREDRAAAWQCLEETVAVLDEWAKEEGVRVGLENMEMKSDEIFVRPADVARLLTRSFKHIGLTLDLAHTQTVMDPLSYLAEIRAEWICHVHLSDNAPSATHLPLGRGRMAVETVLRALGKLYDGIVSLEGYIPGEGETLLANNMAYLRERGMAADPKPFSQDPRPGGVHVKTHNV